MAAFNNRYLKQQQQQVVRVGGSTAAAAAAAFCIIELKLLQGYPRVALALGAHAGSSSSSSM
jgi:hypothetical protein